MNKTENQKSVSTSKKRGARYGKGNIPKELKAEMVAVLPEFGNCQSAVAREFGVSHDVIGRATADPEIAQMAQVKREELGQQFGRLTAKLVAKYERIADEADMSNKGSTLLGIVADKFLAYTGQPTQIIEQQTNSAVTDKVAKMRALVERMRTNYGEAVTRAKVMEIVPELAHLLL